MSFQKGNTIYTKISNKVPIPTMSPQNWRHQRQFEVGDCLTTKIGIT